MPPAIGFQPWQPCCHCVFTFCLFLLPPFRHNYFAHVRSDDLHVLQASEILASFLQFSYQMTQPCNFHVAMLEEQICDLNTWSTNSVHTDECLYFAHNFTTVMPRKEINYIQNESQESRMSDYISPGTSAQNMANWHIQKYYMYYPSLPSLTSLYTGGVRKDQPIT